MGVVLTVVLVAGGLLFASRLLLKPPPGAPEGLGEDTPSSISTRGAWVPAYFGTRKTERVLIGWAGNRTTTQEVVGGGGGKGGGGGGGEVKQTIFFEEAWHIIGLGPASELLEIRFNGKKVWEGPISSDTTPSGSVIDIGKEGEFRIFWGEDEQPYFGTLELITGIGSIWPGVCYIYWQKMRYGTSPAQPQVEYVFKWECGGITLSGSDYLIDNGELLGGRAEGINPGHLMHILLTNDQWLGAGIDKEEIDNTSLEQMGIDLQAENIPVNVSYIDGSQVERAVSSLLQDMGYQLSLVDGRLALLPQRYVDGASYPELTDDMIVPPDNTREINLSPSPITRPVYTFKNAMGYNYRDQDVPFDDDGDASGFGVSTSRRVPLDTVTDIVTASKVAQRRWQETTVRSSITLKALRAARLLVPGQALVRAGLGQLRVLGTRWSDESPVTELYCSPDSYAVPDIDDVLDIPTTGGNQQDPAADLIFKILELPFDLQTGNTLQIVIFRVRAHQQIFSADVYLSNDLTTYSNVGPQPECNGAKLQEAIPLGGPSIIEEGPIIEPLNDDFNSVLDLSMDTAAWQTGKQVALLNGEVFFIESFDAVDEAVWEASENITEGEYRRPAGFSSLRFLATVPGIGTGGQVGSTEPVWPTVVGETVQDGAITWVASRFAFRPKNMIRARYDTVFEEHAIDDIIMIADSADLVPFTLSSFTIGQLACAKTQPMTSGGAVDLASVTAECIILEGDPSDTNDYRSTQLGPRVTDIGDRRIRAV